MVDRACVTMVIVNEESCCKESIHGIHGIFTHTQGESDYTCIGNDITNVEAVRSSLRNQFDKNLVSNFVYQEQILDHAFSHLGLSDERSIAHPVVVTEPVCNPSYCRSANSYKES